jgi:MtN3 and saliva related transmembrane protein
MADTPTQRAADGVGTRRGLQWMFSSRAPIMDFADILGYLAALLTTAAFIPQVWRTFRTHDVSGISLTMYTIFTAGVATWLAYGIVLKETPMILANSLTLIMACGVLTMKMKYRKQKPQPKNA